MVFFAGGNLIRYQMMLMGGDIIMGIFVLVFISSPGSCQSNSSVWTYLFIPLIIVVSYLCEIYKPEGLDPVKKLLRSLIAGTAAFFFLILFLAPPTGGLGQMAIGLLLFIFLQNSWQALFQRTLQSVMFTKNILVIGTGPTARRIEQLIDKYPGRYNLAGYIGTPSDPINVNTDQIVGDIQNIVELSQEYNAHAIVIALTERRGNLIIEKLVTCKLMGVRIIDYPSFFEMLTGKIPVEEINPSWLVQSNGFLITPLVRLMKRIIDIVLASLLLAIMVPFLIPVALIIKLTSPGPVFYFQERVGSHGKPFTIYKFRSMTDDAEKETGAAWARVNDPRVTTFGAFMRKTRIDELPQLINVLKGDMSFIGPRPERPEFVKEISKLTPYYQERHGVKPGITGWAQVMYPYGASLGDAMEKLRYDLYYINNLSFVLEFLIVLETIKVVLFRKGGR